MTFPSTLEEAIEEIKRLRALLEIDTGDNQENFRRGVLRKLLFDLSEAEKERDLCHAELKRINKNTIKEVLDWAENLDA